MTTLLIISAAVGVQLGATWLAYRQARALRDGHPQEPSPMADLAMSAFFWWLALPVFAVRLGNEMLLRSEQKTEATQKIKSGSENGLYE